MAIQHNSKVLPTNLDFINEDEIKEAVKRSGYLLENRILTKFLKKDFAAEANHVIFTDKDENKYHEVDVIASKCIDSIQLKGEESISIFSHFFVECINNSQPLGLFENLGDRDEPSSDWIYEIVNGDLEMQEVISLILPNKIYDYENQAGQGLPSRQYCTFIKKKSDGKRDQWMAYHPDDFHKTLSKLVNTIKFKARDLKGRWDGRQPQILRIDFFIPIIILQNELIKILQQTDIEIDIQIQKLEFFRLKTPYDDAYNRNLGIDIIQEKYFDDYMKVKLDGLLLIIDLLRKGIK